MPTTPTRFPASQAKACADAVCYVPQGMVEHSVRIGSERCFKLRSQERRE
jgi:hypothetical protein